MAAQQVSWNTMMTAVRDEMRTSLRHARQAAVNWMQRTDEIKQEHAGLGDQIRVKLRDDLKRGDFAKTHAWHALNASYLADVLQAELALQEFNVKQQLRGLKGVAERAE